MSVRVSLTHRLSVAVVERYRSVLYKATALSYSVLAPPIVCQYEPHTVGALEHLFELATTHLANRKMYVPFYQVARTVSTVLITAVITMAYASSSYFIDQRLGRLLGTVVAQHTLISPIGSSSNSNEPEREHCAGGTPHRSDGAVFVHDSRHLARPACFENPVSQLWMG